MSSGETKIGGAMSEEVRKQESEKKKETSCFVDATRFIDGKTTAKCPHCGTTALINKAEAGIKTEFSCEHYFWYSPKTNRAVFLKQVYK